MEKLHLTNIDVKWTNKEGQPYLDKKQKPYARVGIQTEEKGKTWISGFAYAGEAPLDWAIGQEVELELTQKEYQGKSYLNFSLTPSKQSGTADKLFAKLDGIEKKIDTLLERNIPL